MLVNADFTRPAVVAFEDYRWVTSPQTGVDRVMLDRAGAEKARATSIVRYAPGSTFPAHHHPGGEEILVLSGTFVDNDGGYRAGWYLRNPPGSTHAPSSPEGAVIFVKLCQMHEHDQSTVRLNTNDPAHWHSGPAGPVCPLYRSEHEEICLLRLASEGRILSGGSAPHEVLVVAGEVVLAERRYAAGSWLRFPSKPPEQFHAGKEGATLYLRIGEFIGIPEGASR